MVQQNPNLELLQSIQQGRKGNSFLSYSKDANNPSIFIFDSSDELFIFKQSSHSLFIQNKFILKIPASDKVNPGDYRNEVAKKAAKLEEKLLVKAVDASTGEEGFLELKSAVRDQLVSLLKLGEDISRYKFVVTSNGKSGKEVRYTCSTLVNSDPYRSDLDFKDLEMKENEKAEAVYLDILTKLESGADVSNITRKSVEQEIWPDNSEYAAQSDGELVLEFDQENDVEALRAEVQALCVAKKVRMTPAVMGVVEAGDQEALKNLKNKLQGA